MESYSNFRRRGSMAILKGHRVVSKSALSVTISFLTLVLYGCEQKQETAKPATTETTEQTPTSQSDSKANHAESTQETTTKENINITTGALDTPPPVTRPIKYSPYPEQNFPNQVFFGDTHLHTAYSADAGLVGASTTPDDAYRFAKGETVISSNGIPARLQRPLDFLVVTDHAENLGLPIALEEDSPVLQTNEWGKKTKRSRKPTNREPMKPAWRHTYNGLVQSMSPVVPTQWPVQNLVKLCGSVSPRRPRNTTILVLSLP